MQIIFSREADSMHSEPQTNLIALIVASSGIWRDALVSLLRAQPNFQVNSVVDDLNAARAALTHKHIDMVVVEKSQDEAALLSFIAWLTVEHSTVRCIAAVDTQAQQGQVEAAGAHATLLKGCLDEALLRAAIALSC